MVMQSKLKEEIIKLCGQANEVPSVGWHFMYNEHHYLCVPNRKHLLLRFSIPHLVKSEDYGHQLVLNAVNETNREVKFIKAVILKNGSVSISYDHKLTEGDIIEQLVPHIIKTLDFASNYIKSKIDYRKFGE